LLDGAEDFLDLFTEIEMELEGSSSLKQLPIVVSPHNRIPKPNLEEARVIWKPIMLDVEELEIWEKRWKCCISELGKWSLNYQSNSLDSLHTEVNVPPKFLLYVFKVEQILTYG